MSVMVVNTIVMVEMTVVFRKVKTMILMQLVNDTSLQIYPYI